MIYLGIMCSLLFWVWMFYDCCKYEKGETGFRWMLVIVLFSLVGAPLYGIARWYPRVAKDGWFGRRNRAVQYELRRAIAETRNIGKAHQFVKLGQVYQKIGRSGDALAAYQQALKKDSNHTEALWGCTIIELRNNNPRPCVGWLRQLMSLRPDYRYGDASLAYGQALFELGDFNEAHHHLEQHLQRWSHPEAAILMAQIQSDFKNAPKACEVLENMIMRVQSAPSFHLRKHRKQVAKGQQMLRMLRSQS